MVTLSKQFLLSNNIKTAKMAKFSGSVKTFQKDKVKRKGVHAKSKMSKSKNSKNYRKTYKGQGR